MEKNEQPYIYTVYLRKGKVERDDVLVSAMMLAKAVAQHKIKHLKLYVHFIDKVDEVLLSSKNEYQRQIVNVNVTDGKTCKEQACDGKRILQRYMKQLPDNMRDNAIELIEEGAKLPKHPDRFNIVRLIIKWTKLIGRLRRQRKKK